MSEPWEAIVVRDKERSLSVKWMIEVGEHGDAGLPLHITVYVEETIRIVGEHPFSPAVPQRFDLCDASFVNLR